MNSLELNKKAEKVGDETYQKVWPRFQNSGDEPLSLFGPKMGAWVISIGLLRYGKLAVCGLSFWDKPTYALTTLAYGVGAGLSYQYLRKNRQAATNARMERMLEWRDQRLSRVGEEFRKKHDFYKS